MLCEPIIIMLSQVNAVDVLHNYAVSEQMRLGLSFATYMY
jgi:hypothetical protein